MAEKVIKLELGQTLIVKDSQILVAKARELADKKGNRISAAPKPTEAAILAELRDFATAFTQETGYLPGKEYPDLLEWVLATGNRPEQLAHRLREANVSNRVVRKELVSLFSQVASEELANRWTQILFDKLKESSNSEE